MVSHFLAEKIFADVTPRCDKKDCGSLVKPGIHKRKFLRPICPHMDLIINSMFACQNCTGCQNTIAVVIFADIVFFGEKLPDKFFQCVSHVSNAPDAVLSGRDFSVRQNRSCNFLGGITLSRSSAGSEAMWSPNHHGNVPGRSTFCITDGQVSIVFTLRCFHSSCLFWTRFCSMIEFPYFHRLWRNLVRIVEFQTQLRDCTSIWRNLLEV